MRKRKQQKKQPRRRPVGKPHRVEPSVSIAFSSVLSSMYNAKTDDQIDQVIQALMGAYHALFLYDQEAAAIFAAKLYDEQMARPFTRYGIEATGDALVDMGVAVPTE